jgi:hypothetical protein
MRILRQFIIAIAVIVGFTSPVVAQETLLTIGVPGDITATNSLNGNVLGETISTAQIDTVLRTVAPGAFGQNFTRDRANRAFVDFNNFKSRMTTSLIQAIQTSEPSVRVDSLLVNTNTLNLRLVQKTNSVSAQLGTVSVSVTGRKSVGIPLFCTSANFSFSLDNIMVSGDYNFISGDVSNAIANFSVNNVRSSCNGLFNFVGNLVLRIADVNSIVKNAIRNEANSQLAFVNMKRIFSLSDFANGLDYFRNENPLTIRANRVIGVFKEIVNDAAVNTPGIALDFKIEAAPFFGGQNKITILASSAPIDVGNIYRPNFDRSVIVELSGATNNLAGIYYSLGGSNWTFAGTSGFLPDGLPENASVIAIATNSVIPGLNSFPGAVGFAPPFRVCRPDYCPAIE